MSTLRFFDLTSLSLFRGLYFTAALHFCRVSDSRVGNDRSVTPTLRHGASVFTYLAGIA